MIIYSYTVNEWLNLLLIQLDTSVKLDWLSSKDTNSWVRLSLTWAWLFSQCSETELRLSWVIRHGDVTVWCVTDWASATRCWITSWSCVCVDQFLSISYKLNHNSSITLSLTTKDGYFSATTSVNTSSYTFDAILWHKTWFAADDRLHCFQIYPTLASPYRAHAYK